MVKFLQINTQHSKQAQAYLINRLDKERNTIALVQEPYIYRGQVCNTNGKRHFTAGNEPKTAVYVPNNICSTNNSMINNPIIQ